MAACLVAAILAVTLGTVSLEAADALSAVAAARASDVAALRAVLKSGARVNEAEPDGTTALHWAAFHDSPEMLRLLLDAGGDASKANRYGVTPLYLAATNGSLLAVQALLAAGVDPLASLPEGETVVMAAARAGNAGVIEELATRGAPVDAPERWLGETALMWAAANDRVEAIEALVRLHAEVDRRSSVSTIARLKFPRLNLLTIEFPDGGWTALMYAARQGAVQATRALARAGADLNLQDPRGSTALSLAIINGHYDVARELLVNGADPNVVDASGMGPLYAAVDMRTLRWTYGRPAPVVSGTLDSDGLIGLLLDKGADPNARLLKPTIQRHHTPGDPALSAGATPFMRAAKSGDVAVMRLLVERGADPKITQDNQVTALMLAAGLGWRADEDGDGNSGSEVDAAEAVRFCASLGLEVNATSANGDTAAHASVGRGDQVIRAVHELGADFTAKNKRGQTPLDIAMRSRERKESTVTLVRELTGPTSEAVQP